MTTRVAARRRRSPGQLEAWPTRRAKVYCFACRSLMREPTTHASTSQHRRATRPPEYARRSGHWLGRRYFDYSRRPADEGTEAQNRRAARRLGLTD